MNPLPQRTSTPGPVTGGSNGVATRPALRRRVRQASLAFACLGLASGACRANDSFGSEISHVFFGMGMGGGVTVLANQFDPENRFWIGVGTVAVLALISEGAQVASNGSSQVKGSVLDFASNVVGALIGSYIADQYILAPVVTKEAAGGSRYGVSFAMKF